MIWQALSPTSNAVYNVDNKIIMVLTDILEEHLSEASFLYEQRLGLLNDLELTWKEIGDFEERFEAHIDGLVVGGNSALDVCKQQATEGDFGELHAAMRVFCRQNRLDLALQSIEAIDTDDAERMQAVCDALKDELPQGWQNHFIELLNEGNPKWVSVIPQLIGYQRLNVGVKLLQALQENHTRGSLVPVISALGRLREQQAREPLLNIFQRHEDETIRAATALTLLRLGDPKIIEASFDFAHTQNWPLISLGLGGGRSAVPRLCDLASSEPSADGLMALGLLGDLSAVDLLLANMANTKLAEAAARAFNLITGAEIDETVFIPEEINEDELFEEELEKMKRGEPLYPPGHEPGVHLTRLSQKHADWQNWWGQNKSRFNPQIRYRSGKPYSPAILLENLESEKNPRQVRQWAYEELVIRYGVDFPFETDMPVEKQKQAMKQYAEWIANNSRFREGQWYFGKIMAS